MRLSKVEFNKRWNFLRKAVNEWDPAGLIGGRAPQDEYDCLVGPLLGLLEKGVPADEIAVYLEQELASHFECSVPDVKNFLDQFIQN